MISLTAFAMFDFFELLKEIETNFLNTINAKHLYNITKEMKASTLSHHSQAKTLTLLRYLNPKWIGSLKFNLSNLFSFYCEILLNSTRIYSHLLAQKKKYRNFKKFTEFICYNKKGDQFEIVTFLTNKKFKFDFYCIIWLKIHSP